MKFNKKKICKIVINCRKYMIYRILFFILHTRKKTSLTIKVYTSYYIYIFASVVQNRNKLLFLHCTILYDQPKTLCVCNKHK